MLRVIDATAFNLADRELLGEASASLLADLCFPVEMVGLNPPVPVASSMLNDGEHTQAVSRSDQCVKEGGKTPNSYLIVSILRSLKNLGLGRLERLSEVVVVIVTVKQKRFLLPRVNLERSRIR
jgi:hypothetical protein